MTLEAQNLHSQMVLNTTIGQKNRIEMLEIGGWQRPSIACFTHGTGQGEHSVTSNKTDETWVTDIATKNKGSHIPRQGF